MCFFGGEEGVVLVTSSAGFELHTLALMQVKKKKKDCSCTIEPETPEMDLNCPRSGSESVGDPGTKQHGAQKS